MKTADALRTLGLALLAAACSRPSAPPDTRDAAAPPPASAPAPEVAVKSGIYLGATAKHACAIDSAGTMRCWGSNSHGQLGDIATAIPRVKPVAVYKLPPVVMAALGARHTCAVQQQDGNVVCWGDNRSGQLGDVDAPGRAVIKGVRDTVQVVAGEAFTCALDAAHHVTCWGLLPDIEAVKEATPIPDLEATRLAASSRSVCAVRTSGAVACWGDNRDRNILADGPRRVERPTDVSFREARVKVARATDVALTDASACAVMTEGEVVCWGKTWRGSQQAEREYRMENAEAITAGASGHFCMRDRGGKMECWGNSATGATGSQRYSRNALDGLLFHEVRAGFDFTCGRADKGVMCWGTNSAGQLALDFEDAITRPRKIEAARGARTLAAGDGVMCTIAADYTVHCFGPDATTQPNEAAPRTIGSIAKADDIVMGGGVACAMTARLPTCWGDNRASLLPSQNAVTVYPSTLASLRDAKQLVFGADHACSLSDDGAVACWGGLGKARVTPKPIRVDKAAAVAVGADEGCALLADGTVTCFPLHDPPAGEAGAARFTPAKVNGVRGARLLAHGPDHGCVIDTRNGVHCWGRDDQAAPVAGIEGATELAIGDGFTCARRIDGTVVCWGKGDRGQLGDGKREDRAEPRAVDGLSGVKSIRASTSHVCALDAEGSVYCWGDNRARNIASGSPLIVIDPVTIAVP
jgi:alpha-tubulin suppressor-like RCC1 family protein